MRVCRVMRATSKRLCFSASMARSNNTLSGCLEPTLERGLLTFLLVQATLQSSAPSRTTTETKRDIRTSGENLPGCARPGRRRNCSYANGSNFQQRGLGGGFQELLGILFWIAFAEDRVACHQNFSAGAHHLGHGVEGNAAIDLDAEIQAATGPGLGQAAHLVQGVGQKRLSAEAGVHRHDEH